METNYELRGEASMTAVGDPNMTALRQRSSAPMARDRKSVPETKSGASAKRAQRPGAHAAGVP